MGHFWIALQNAAVLSLLIVPWLSSTSEKAPFTSRDTNLTFLPVSYALGRSLEQHDSSSDWAIEGIWGKGS